MKKQSFIIKTTSSFFKILLSCLILIWNSKANSQELKTGANQPVYVSHDGQIIHPGSIPEQYKQKREFPDSWIVEFKGEPLAKKPAGLKSASLNVYQNTFNNFENDLQNISSSGNKLKSAKIIRINRKFKNAFFGASVDNVSSSMLDQIKKLPYVKTVYPNEISKGHLSESSGIINAPTARINHGVTGKGVKVGILDSGIDYNHPALGSGFGEGYKVAGGYDFVNDDNDPMDDFFHGTHVAGIVASQDETYMGIAPDVKLYALKCINQYNEAQEDDIIAAIEWALDPNGDGNFEDKLDIINLSLGSSNGNALDAKSIAVNNISEAGILCVISAGNDGGFNNIGSPGTAEKALTVGNCNKDLQMAQNSSGGPAGGNGYIKPEVVVPGENITSTLLNSEFGARSGTSQAAPHVAGICALLKEKHPDWTPEEIKSAIIQSCTPLADVELMKQGAGLVDAEKALSCETLISPALVNLGNISFQNNFYTKEIQLTFKNESQTEKTYSLLQKNRRYGSNVSFSESEFSLNPGIEKHITTTFEIPVGAIPNEVPFSGANAIDGLIEVTENGKPVNLPWAIIKGVKVKFKVIGEWDKFFSSFFITNESNYYNSIDGYNSGDSSFTVLAKPGIFHLLFDGTELIESKNFFNHRIVLKDSLRIYSDTTIALDLTQSHLLSFEGLNNEGKLLNEGEYYRKNIGIKLPNENMRTEYVVNILDDYNAIFVSSFNSTFTVFPFEYSDEYLDKKKYTIVNYTPLKDLSSSKKFQNNPSNLSHTTIQTSVPENSPNPMILIPYRFHGKEAYKMKDPDNPFIGGFGFSHQKKEKTDSVDIFIETNNSEIFQFGFNIGATIDSPYGFFQDDYVEFQWDPRKLINNRFRMVTKTNAYHPIHYLNFQESYSLPSSLIFPRFTISTNPQIYGHGNTFYGNIVELVFYGMQEERLPLSSSSVYALLTKDSLQLLNQHLYQMEERTYPRWNVDQGNYYYYLFKNHSTGLIKYKTSCFIGKKGSENNGAGPNIKLFQIINSEGSITNQIDKDEQAKIKLIAFPSVSWLNPELNAKFYHKPEGAFNWESIEFISDSINYDKKYNYMSCQLPNGISEGYYDFKINMVNEIGETTELTYHSGLIIGSPQKNAQTSIGEVKDTSCYIGDLIIYKIPAINYYYDSCTFEAHNIHEDITINVIGNELAIHVKENINPGSYPIEIRLLKNNDNIDSKIFNLKVKDNDLYIKKHIPDTVVYVNSPPLKIPIHDVFASKTETEIEIFISENTNPNLVIPFLQNDTIYFPFEEFNFGKCSITLTAKTTDSLQMNFLVDRSIKNQDKSQNELPYDGINFEKNIEVLNIESGKDTVIDISNWLSSEKTGFKNIEIKLKYVSNSIIKTSLSNNKLYISANSENYGQSIIYFDVWNNSIGVSEELKFQLLVNVSNITLNNNPPAITNYIEEIVFETYNAPIKNFNLENYFNDPDEDELSYELYIDKSFVANGYVDNNKLLISSIEGEDFYFHDSNFKWMKNWHKWTNASITAKDNQGASITQEFRIRFENCIYNENTSILKNFENITATSSELSEMYYNLYHYFSNFDLLEFSSSDYNIVNPYFERCKTSDLRFNPGDSLGSCLIKVYAIDSECGYSVSQSFNVTVIPEITKIKAISDTVTICRNDYFQLNSLILGFDSDGNSYDLSSNLNWQEIGQGYWNGSQEYICNWGFCRTYIAEYNGLNDTLTICPSQTEDIFDVKFICQGDSTFLGGRWRFEPGEYRDTLINSIGCDSIVKVTLTVHPTYNHTDAASICLGETYQFGTQSLTTSGEYTELFQSENGCDSIVTLTLTVHPVFESEESITICEGGSHKGWTVTDTYTENLVSAFGCDSTVITHLTVNDVYEVFEDIEICAGEDYNGWTESDTYSRTLTSATGCDSIVTTHLTVHPVFETEESITICEGGSHKGWTEPDTYTENLTSRFGCDSIVITHLTVNDAYEVSEDIEICAGEDYNGWTESNTYSRTLTSANGCDSIVTTNLVVHPSYQPNVLISGDTLKADTDYTTYQWYDENGIIPGATGKEFVINKTGEYFLEITDENGCANRSVIVNAVYSSIASNSMENFRYSIIPNPNSGIFNFRVDSRPPGSLTLKLINPVGQIIDTRIIKSVLINHTEQFNVEHLSKGMYFLNIVTDKNERMEKIIIF